MSDERAVSVTGGVGVVGLLGVAFVVLKLCGVIDWSWWLVTLPFWWMVAAFVVGVGILVMWRVLRAVVVRRWSP